jgi:hypothetical protein
VIKLLAPRRTSGSPSDEKRGQVASLSSEGGFIIATGTADANGCAPSPPPARGSRQIHAGRLSAKSLLIDDNNNNTRKWEEPDEPSLRSTSSPPSYAEECGLRSFRLAMNQYDALVAKSEANSWSFLPAAGPLHQLARQDTGVLSAITFDDESGLMSLLLPNHPLEEEAVASAMPPSQPVRQRTVTSFLEAHDDPDDNAKRDPDCDYGLAPTTCRPVDTVAWSGGSGECAGSAALVRGVRANGASPPKMPVRQVSICNDPARLRAAHHLRIGGGSSASLLLPPAMPVRQRTMSSTALASSRLLVRDAASYVSEVNRDGEPPYSRGGQVRSYYADDCSDVDSCGPSTDQRPPISAAALPPTLPVRQASLSKHRKGLKATWLGTGSDPDAVRRVNVKASNDDRAKAIPPEMELLPPSRPSSSERTFNDEHHERASHECEPPSEPQQFPTLLPHLLRHRKHIIRRSERPPHLPCRKASS